MYIVGFLEIFFLDFFLGGVGQRFSYGFRGGGVLSRGQKERIVSVISRKGCKQCQKVHTMQPSTVQTDSDAQRLLQLLEYQYIAPDFGVF